MTGDEDYTECRFRQINRSRRFRMVGEFFRRGTDELRPEAPPERVPAGLEKSHESIADKKECADLDQTAGCRIICHELLFACGSRIFKSRATLENTLAAPRPFSTVNPPCEMTCSSAGNFVTAARNREKIAGSLVLKLESVPTSKRDNAGGLR